MLACIRVTSPCIKGFANTVSVISENRTPSHIFSVIKLLSEMESSTFEIYLSKLTLNKSPHCVKLNFEVFFFFFFFGIFIFLFYCKQINNINKMKSNLKSKVFQFQYKIYANDVQFMFTFIYAPAVRRFMWF